MDAKYAGFWEPPVIGVVPGPTAVLIRPDGYVAWVEDTAHPGLADALTILGSDRLLRRSAPASKFLRIAELTSIGIAADSAQAFTCLTKPSTRPRPIYPSLFPETKYEF